MVLFNVLPVTRLLTPIMVAQGGVAVVNISTYAAVEPSPANSVSTIFLAGPPRTNVCFRFLANCHWAAQGPGPGRDNLTVLRVDSRRSHNDNNTGCLRMRWSEAPNGTGKRIEAFERRRRHQAHGMGGIPIVGDPDFIVAEIARMAKAGIRGIGVSFVNYLEELPYFCDEVLPRLERMGLRENRQ